jgi:hypothetical protein
VGHAFDRPGLAAGGRVGVWAVLLASIARLPLRLSPLHPDRAAGLGFLTIYPSIFGGFAFALGRVIASAMMKELEFNAHSTQMLLGMIAGWLVLTAVLFIGPLSVFAPRLLMTRDQGLLDHGGLASQHHLEFDAKWIASRRDGRELVGSNDPSSVADLNASVETVQSMRLVPVDGTTALRLLIAAGLPMLPLLATRVPLAELLGWILGAVF